jgi:hypothetical protein
LDFQKQYNVRNRKEVVNPPKNPSTNQAATSQPNKDLSNKYVQKKDEEKYALKKDVSREKDLQENASKKILSV